MDTFEVSMTAWAGRIGLSVEPQTAHGWRLGFIDKNAAERPNVRFTILGDDYELESFAAELEAAAAALRRLAERHHAETRP